MGTAFADWLNEQFVSRKSIWTKDEVVAEMVGASPAAVGKWRRGKSVPELKYLIRFGDITGIDVWYLISIAYDVPMPGEAHNVQWSPVALEVARIVETMTEAHQIAVLQLVRSLRETSPDDHMPPITNNNSG